LFEASNAKGREIRNADISGKTHLSHSRADHTEQIAQQAVTLPTRYPGMSGWHIDQHKEYSHTGVPGVFVWHIGQRTEYSHTGQDGSTTTTYNG
jgi:hypothetical protein